MRRSRGIYTCRCGSSGARSVNDDVRDREDLHEHPMLPVLVLCHALKHFCVDAEDFVVVEELLVVAVDAHRAVVLFGVLFILKISSLLYLLLQRC